jgi:tRNA pseudouridine38-40 synthase
MARYKVILAYDGTEFKGFQRQAGKSTARTVQNTFESALREIGWSGEAILSAGRTDAGVHASGQVISFDLEWKHGEAELAAALNANLPADVAVREVSEALEGFHPRYDAVSRRYCYRIFTDPIRDPQRERFAWRIWPPVDGGLLEATAGAIIGSHDFRAFGSAPHAGGTTVRRVFKAEWCSKESELVFEIQANAFLYRMVRKLVGYQVEIGQGKLELQAMKERLQDQCADLVRNIAPPHGLSLEAVEYVR